MSYANESPKAAQDPHSNPTPPPHAARKRREWPFVVGMSAVALALLLALLYAAWWYFGGWFD